MMGKVCAFFGHRDIWMDYSKPLEELVRKVVAEGVSDFWLGGYGAFDSCAAGVLKRLKKELPHIRIFLILAYLPEKKDLLSAVYDGTIFPEGMEVGPRRFAITKRNIWIAKNCDILITYLDREYGGAYSAYKVARKQGKMIYNLGSLNV
mgnify:CR=1 FL=1